MAIFFPSYLVEADDDNKNNTPQPVPAEDNENDQPEPQEEDTGNDDQQPQHSCNESQLRSGSNVQGLLRPLLLHGHFDHFKHNSDP